MLVLTRRTKESIVIDGDITVTVLEVDRTGQVRLGIDAPKRVRVLRQEVVAAIEQENREAVAASQQLDVLEQLQGLVAPKQKKDEAK